MGGGSLSSNSVMSRQSWAGCRATAAGLAGLRPISPPCARCIRSATEALKLVGESFPWSGAPGWAPPRRVTPGGVNETYAVTTPGCSSYDPRAAARGQSNYVYLRANHKARGHGGGRLGCGDATLRAQQAAVKWA